MLHLEYEFDLFLLHSQIILPLSQVVGEIVLKMVEEPCDIQSQLQCALLWENYRC